MSHFFYSWNYTLDISKQSQIILTLDIVIDYVSIQSAVKIVQRNRRFLPQNTVFRANFNVLFINGRGVPTSPLNGIIA